MSLRLRFPFKRRLNQLPPKVVQERTSGDKLLQLVSGVRPALMWCSASVQSFNHLPPKCWTLVQERTSGAKLLQRVSGVRPAVMWCSAFVWDWLWLLLVHTLIIITLACFQEPTLSTPQELGKLVATFIYAISIGSTLAQGFGSTSIVWPATVTALPEWVFPDRYNLGVVIFIILLV